MEWIELSIVFIVLFVIFTGWICIVLTKQNKDTTIEELKQEATIDGIINRHKLGELIRQAILTGKWNP